MKDTDVISRYLLGELDKKELNQFTLQLIKDKQFRKKVDAERLLHETILRDKGSYSAVKNLKNKFLILRIFLILALGGLVIFFIRKGAVSSPLPEKQIIEQPKKNLPEKKEILPEIKPESKQAKKNKPNTNSKPPKPEIFAANFEKNPLLEVYFTEMRSKNIRITSPEQITEFSQKEGKIDFRLEGNFQSEAENPEESVLFHLFSNKKDDYQDFKPLTSEALNFEFDKKTKQLDFLFEKNIALNSGLYYYLLEGEDSGLLYVGKFKLK